MRRILVVDDEPNICWTLSALLRRAGYEPVMALDFGAALAVLDRTPVDAAVIDVILEQKSGIELLKEIQKRRECIPVIVITVDPYLVDIPETLHGGALYFLAKPVVKATLLRAVSLIFRMAA